MERCRWCMTFSVVLMAAIGCGQSADVAVDAAAQQSAQSSAVAKLGETPERAVFEFLEAVRTGDDQQAGAMLTELAKQKTSEMEMVVAPPGSDTAKFEVGQAEYVADAKDTAQVASKWIDVHDGQPQSDEITWIVRQGSAGWRIAGMATRIFEDQQPVVLNFENPEEMLQKQRLAQEEMGRRADSSDLQARMPAQAGSTIQR